jgi:hypothetical protein
VSSQARVVAVQPSQGGATATVAPFAGCQNFAISAIPLTIKAAPSMRHPFSG